MARVTFIYFKYYISYSNHNYVIWYIMIDQTPVKTMIKRIKNFHADALINSDEFRDFVEKSESEILRGISTIITLKIIAKKDDDGIYGYELLKEIEKMTNSTLVIEEGTLYPLLRKLENAKLLNSKREEKTGRPRKYYYITKEGKHVSNHLQGFFSKLVESMGDLLDIDVDLKDTYFYCPNCANKIDVVDTHVKFCEVCGLNIESYLNNEQMEDL